MNPMKTTMTDTENGVTALRPVNTAINHLPRFAVVTPLAPAPPLIHLRALLILALVPSPNRHVPDIFPSVSSMMIWPCIDLHLHHPPDTSFSAVAPMASPRKPKIAVPL